MKLLKTNAKIIDSFIIVSQLTFNNGIYTVEVRLYENSILIDINKLNIADNYKRAIFIYNIVLYNDIFPAHLKEICEEFI